MIIIKSNYEVEQMRKAGKITAKAHEAVKKAIKSGVSTLELDEIARDVICSNGAKVAFLNYMGYPRNICTSINEQVVHGIPDEKTILREGDIVSVDIGSFYNGYCGDAAKTYAVGKISEEAQKLNEVTKQSFYEGLKYCEEGYRLVDVQRAIQEYVEKNGFSVVKEYTGHGVGQKMHEDPSIPNYDTGIKGPRLQKGMCLAIEPMVNAGGEEVKVLSDGWTVVTKDKSLSSHYEHSVAVTDGKPILLTAL